MTKHGYRVWMLVVALLFALALFAGCSGSESSGEGAPCVNNADCTFGHRCLNSTCVSLRCTHPRDCLTGEYCKFDAGAEQGICTVRPDADTDPADADEEDGDTEEEPPAGICMLNERRCRGDILEICSNFNNFLDWRFEADCPHGCVLGACVDPPVEDGDDQQICEPENMQCYSNQVQRCSETGDAWEVVDACIQGTCVEETTGGVTLASCGPRLICQPGMRICDDEGSLEAVKVCNDAGTDWRIVYCQSHEACMNGICQSATACTRGRYRCNGNIVEKCRDNGSGWDRVRTCTEEETCACGSYAGSECTLASCTRNAVCTPLLDTRCSGNVVQRCDSTGTGWAFWSDCAAKDPPETCVNGSCQ